MSLDFFLVFVSIFLPCEDLFLFCWGGVIVEVMRRVVLLFLPCDPSLFFC